MGNTAVIVGTVAGTAVVGAGGYLLYQELQRRKAAASLDGKTKQTLEQALMAGGVAGCQAAGMAYKVPPQISGPLCGIASVVAGAGIKAVGKAMIKNPKKVVVGLVTGGPVGAVVAPFAKTVAKGAVGGVKAVGKSIGKIFGLGDIDADLTAYAVGSMAGPSTASKRARRTKRRGGCKGPCGCAPCAGRGTYTVARARVQVVQSRTARGASYYLAQLGG